MLESSKSFNIIVFSKDRAMQLELFLHSFNRFVKNADEYLINVLYTYSRGVFKDGYDKLIGKEYPNVNFVKETYFKNDFLSLILPYNEFTVFFVDDNVFKNQIDFYDGQMEIFRANPTIICRSLRLHRNLKYCYPARVNMKPPIFDKDGVFKWRGQVGDYGYPFSVDGHIFRTDDILPLVRNTEFTNPNTFEGNVQHHRIGKDYMICYKQSIIFNNPVNKVQTVNDNIHGSISAKWLNDQFLNGKRIKLESFVGLENISCHQEVPIELEDEGNSN